MKSYKCLACGWSSEEGDSHFRHESPQPSSCYAAVKKTHHTKIEIRHAEIDVINLSVIWMQSKWIE